ncbi:MAG: tyrosine-protein phosphatase, partial [Sphingobium sp.]
MTDSIDRLLPLTGGFNLRDFGGYATADGRMVRRGMLFRSGTMSLLTEADCAHLRGLGIRSICDFRRPSERRHEPTRWHGADVDYYARDYSGSSGVLAEMIKDGTATAHDMRTAMIHLYRTIHVDHAEAYHAMFARLAEGKAPMLINCSAGKDRTGTGAALILALLGVPRDTIVEDYL